MDGVIQKDVVLRSLLLCIFLLSCLTSCVNFQGVRGSSSRPYNSAYLENQHYFLTPHHFPSIDWWSQFHDPQLNQLIAVALSDSPTMKQAAARLRAAAELTDETASSLWPYVNLNGYIRRVHFSKFGLVPPPFNGKTFNIADIALNFTYELDFWGKNRQLLAAALNEECAYAADIAEAKLVLAAAITTAYFQIQSNRRQAQLALATYRARQKIADIVFDRAKRGIESNLPVSTAISAAESSRIGALRYKELEWLSRHRLAVLLGKNPLTTRVSVRPFSYRRYRIALPCSLPANLLAERPDIVAARLRTDAAANQVKVAKARFFPNINLNALLSFQSLSRNNTFLSRLFNSQSRNNGIGAAFDLPIFDAGALRSNLGIRYAEFDKAVNNYNQTILNALQDVANQLSTRHTLVLQQRAQDELLHATRNNYKLMTSRYRHGIVDYLMVLQFKESLLQQQAEQVKLQTRDLQTTVLLIKALGGQYV